MTYSDFYGYAPFIASWTWFMLYWTAFCVFLAAVSILLWQRGRETSWSSRIRNARLRFHGAVRFVTIAAAIGFVATGAWIFYNTKILNTVRSENDADRLRADYEKTYKKFEKQPEPRITDVKYAIDLYPESRNMTMRGQQTIANQTAKPLTEIHFTLDKDYQTTIEIPSAKLSQDDQRLGYQVYALTPPMQPGESRVMQFTMKTVVRGFENSLTNRAVLPNGTFIHSRIVPQIGYQTGNELDDKNKRKRFGLKEKDLMPALEQNCEADCRDSYISNNSDWVSVETVIRTSPDQIEIAPGS